MQLQYSFLLVIINFHALDPIVTSSEELTESFVPCFLQNKSIIEHLLECLMTYLSLEIFQGAILFGFNLKAIYLMDYVEQCLFINTIGKLCDKSWEKYVTYVLCFINFEERNDMN